MFFARKFEAFVDQGMYRVLYCTISSPTKGNLGQVALSLLNF
jgi:hypothetical protein